MRNIVFFLLAIALLAGCAGTVKVQTATSQVWRGGAAGSGGGKYYVVTFAKPSKTAITIEQVWVGERDKGWLPRFQVLPQPSDTADPHVAHAGPTEFTLKFSETYPGEPHTRGEGPKTMVFPFDNPPNDLPADFTHGAVIYYRIGNTAGKWVVSEFEILPPLNYP